MTTSLLNSLLRALLRWGAALVFCLPLRHRSHFWGRACGMLFPLLLLAQLLDPLAQSTTLWQQQLLLLVLYVSFFALLGGMIYLCTDINKKGAIYCAVWSLLIAQCAYEGWCYLELYFAKHGHPLNMASPWAVLVQLLSGTVFFAAVYLLLARQLPYKGEYYIGPRQLLSSFFIGSLFMVQAAVLDNFRAEQFPQSLVATILIGQFYFITLLYFQSELFKKSAMEKEMNALNLLYERQRQQYQVARQNVQMINKRCHELKVQIANLRKLSPEAVPQERIEEAERAARLYECRGKRQLSGLYRGGEPVRAVCQCTGSCCGKRGADRSPGVPGHRPAGLCAAGLCGGEYHQPAAPAGTAGKPLRTIRAEGDPAHRAEI